MVLTGINIQIQLTLYYPNKEEGSGGNKALGHKVPLSEDLAPPSCRNMCTDSGSQGRSVVNEDRQDKWGVRQTMEGGR